MSTQVSNKARFLVALSFPGEKRSFVRDVADHLSAVLGRERVFYDDYYKSELAIPNLNTYIQNIYSQESSFVVSFFSEDYARKSWCCNVEWPAILATLQFANKPDNYLMAMRFDNTPIPGFLPSSGYVFIGDMQPKEVSQLILERVLGSKYNKFDESYKGHLIGEFPISYSDNFVGRKKDIDYLHQLIQSNENTAITQTITGIGGIGKTRLAAEYIHRHKKAYSYILYVRAIDSSTNNRITDPDVAGTVISPSIDAGLSRLGGFIAGHSFPIEPLNDRVLEILKYIRSLPKPWLLLLDNVDTELDAKCLARSLGYFEGGKLIITARWSRWGQGFCSFPLETITLKAARDLLLKMSPDRELQVTDTEDALDLAFTLSGLSKDDQVLMRVKDPNHILGGFPLVLEQAACYIDSNQISIGDYKDKWRNEARRIGLLKNIDIKMSHEESLLVTVSQTLNRISASALSALTVVSWLSSEPIPKALLKDNAKWKERTKFLVSAGRNSHSEYFNDSWDSIEALSELRKYSLLNFLSETVSIHGMVQECVRLLIAQKNIAGWVRGISEILKIYLPDDPPAFDVRSWNRWDPMRSHIEMFWARIHGLLPEVWKNTKSAEQVKSDLSLANDLACYYFGKGLYFKSLEIEKSALEMMEIKLGSMHAFLSHRLVNYGESLRVLGREEEARNAFRRAISIDEENTGENSQEVASDLNYLSLVLVDAEEREGVLRRALSIHDSIEHPKTHQLWKCLSNLGSLLTKKGEYEEAEKHLTRAINLISQELGEEHPNLLFPLVHLSYVYENTSSLFQADNILRRALSIVEGHLPLNHPHRITVVDRMSRYFRNTHRLAEARSTIETLDEIDYFKWGSAESHDIPFREFISKLRICEIVLFSDLAGTWCDQINDNNDEESDNYDHEFNEWHPVMMKGLAVLDCDNFRISSTIDSGSEKNNRSHFRAESMKLFDYFLTALAVPEESQWAPATGEANTQIRNTKLGNDLCKQARNMKSLIKWLLYSKKNEIETLLLAMPSETDSVCKLEVWISPDKTTVYTGNLEGDLSHLNVEGDSNAFVVENDLKVYCELRFTSMSKQENKSDIVIEKTIQEFYEKWNRSFTAEIQKHLGKCRCFGTLRQILNCMILARWFKEKYRLRVEVAKYIETGNSNQLKPSGLDID